MKSSLYVVKKRDQEDMNKKEPVFQPGPEWLPEWRDSERTTNQIIANMSWNDLQKKAIVRGIPSDRKILQDHMTKELFLINVTGILFWSTREMEKLCQQLNIHHDLDHYHASHYVIMVIVQRNLPFTITKQRKIKLK